MIDLENNCLQPAFVSYGLPKGSFLGLLLFLKCENDMSQAVTCDPLYADDSCLDCQHKDFNKTENQLNEEFCNIRDWFTDKKWSIHFGEDKTKWILFYSKFKKKNIKKHNIECRDIKIELTL